MNERALYTGCKSAPEICYHRINDWKHGSTYFQDIGRGKGNCFWIKSNIDRMREEGVRIDNAIGIGGIALKSPFIMQTLSDVLNMPIKVCRTEQACALGASMFAATAAGIYDTVQDAQAATNSGFALEYTLNSKNVGIYSEIYKQYLKIGEFTEENL